VLTTRVQAEDGGRHGLSLLRCFDTFLTASRPAQDRPLSREGIWYFLPAGVGAGVVLAP
jgi:hypothetical protein